MVEILLRFVLADNNTDFCTMCAMMYVRKKNKLLSPDIIIISTISIVYKRASLSEDASFDSRRWLAEEDLARQEGEDATSRRTASMDHRLGSPALRKTKTSKR
ncbi:unnamed protein product [Angiostrongylus costaricensis]|uniref:Uncharacterized protein n=1 Tax=Angiostrongylus costaricensis TaxID=334426 RepID=A0A0R3Q289_ANGCS|nr:unnamed protein product [Angiostrongylus costaricensis]